MSELFDSYEDYDQSDDAMPCTSLDEYRKQLKKMLLLRRDVDNLRTDHANARSLKEVWEVDDE